MTRLTNTNSGRRAPSRPDWIGQFAQNLKALRKRHNLTQSDLAKLASVEQANISRFESGTVPTTDIMVRLAAALATSVEELIADSPPSNMSEVPIVGYVAAQEDAYSAIYPFDDYAQGDEGFGFIEVPFRLEPGYVGLEIRGPSQEPMLKDRDVIIYRRDGDYMAEQCLGRMCVVKLDDDSVLLKEMRQSRTTPGRFDLLSFNAPTMLAQQVIWAAPITAHLPR